MKKKLRVISLTMIIAVLLSSLSPSVFAKTFATTVDATNLGVQTQYLYDSNNPSWLRKLVVKEDMLSTDGILNEAVLYPVCDYPYTMDAPTFKKQVQENIELYTLDDDSQKAAYLYFFQQLGALTIISEPDTTDATKADWLRAQGIVVTKEDEEDPDKILMISALYALMRNDLYYVYTGERLTIPKGTPLEEALVMYVAALSGQNSTLYEFISKHFGTSSIVSLEDYIYYTSLMSLYTQGYVSATELTTISRNEVYRRVAIMTIRNYGIAIDSETATTEEIRLKYLTAMLGTTYKVTLDPTSLEKTLRNSTVPFYILQRMAFEDANLAVSSTSYSYDECFNIVLNKTSRFNLENEFYSDIYEYNLYLGHLRNNIYINPTPISNSGVTVYIDGKSVTPGEYANTALNGSGKQSINIICRSNAEGKTNVTTYKVNIIQGTEPAPDSNLTGILTTINSILTSAAVTISGAITPNLPDYSNYVLGTDNELYSINASAPTPDMSGNLYETLPEGYIYTVDESGNISIVLADSYLTEPTTREADNTDNTDNEKTKKIAVVISAACLIILIAIIIIAVKTKKGKNGKTEAEKMRSGKLKEKKKRERKSK